MGKPNDLAAEAIRNIKLSTHFKEQKVSAEYEDPGELLSVLTSEIKRAENALVRARHIIKALEAQRGDS